MEISDEMTTPKREKFEKWVNDTYPNNLMMRNILLDNKSFFDVWQAALSAAPTPQSTDDAYQEGYRKGVADYEKHDIERLNAQMLNPTPPDPAIDEELTPNQRRALSRGLSALEAMAGLWAAEIRLQVLAEKLACAPDKNRAKGIAAMIEQAFIEGAYRHYLDHKDAAPTPPEVEPVALSDEDISAIGSTVPGIRHLPNLLDEDQWATAECALFEFARKVRGQP